MKPEYLITGEISGCRVDGAICLEYRKAWLEDEFDFDFGGCQGLDGK